MMTFLIDDTRIAHDVAGWFSWPEFYERIVNSAPDGSTIVEIGVFCGQSLIYLAQRARESGKNLRLIGIDTFQGSPEFEGKVFFNDQQWSDAPIDAAIRMCMNNLARYEVLNDVTLIVSDSVKAAELFQDRSVYAVFIDGDHTEEGVSRDIRAWRPKVQPGGVMAGDDYHGFPTVKAAVDRLIPDATIYDDKTWWEKAC